MYEKAGHQKYTVNRDLLEREDRGNTRGHFFQFEKKNLQKYIMITFF